jgi:hypothetical protein
MTAATARCLPCIWYWPSCMCNCRLLTAAAATESHVLLSALPCQQ